jgi:hypothetical protein
LYGFIDSSKGFSSLELDVVVDPLDEGRADRGKVVDDEGLVGLGINDQRHWLEGLVGHGLHRASAAHLRIEKRLRVDLHREEHRAAAGSAVEPMAVLGEALAAGGRHVQIPRRGR